MELSRAEFLRGLATTAASMTLSSTTGWAGTTERHYETLIDTAEAIKSRKISPVELTRAMLDRIARVDSSLHSYASVSAEVAFGQAKQAETEIAAGRYRGPLHGMPIALKDIIDTAGIPTSRGMPIYASRVPERDATVTKRLLDSGAVLLGKLQLTEGAFAKHHPKITAPKNPWNVDYYAGASSSGSGVAPAAGLCFGCLASDTGGSIRYPASANGLTGFKPTWGRVSLSGVFPLAPSMDHIGPMTRSVADAAAMLQVIAGLDANDPTSLAAPVPDYLANINKGIQGLRIGIDTSYNETDVDADIVRAVRETRRVLQERGATIREIKLPDHNAVAAGWGALCGLETSMVHADTYPSRASEYGPSASGTIAGLIDYGRTVTAIDLMKVNYARLAFTARLNALFTDIDLLLIPTQPLADFTLKQEADLFTRPADLAAFLRFATPFDMSGHPTLVIPNGFTAKGMPLSCQLVGRHLDEALLLRAGHAYQQATDWHRKHPSV